MIIFSRFFYKGNGNWLFLSLTSTLKMLSCFRTFFVLSVYIAAQFLYCCSVFSATYCLISVYLLYLSILVFGQFRVFKTLSRHIFASIFWRFWLLINCRLGMIRSFSVQFQFCWLSFALLLDQFWLSSLKELNH